MLKLKIILLAFLSSVILHVVLFFGFTFYGNTKLTPYVFMWPEVLDKNYSSNKIINIDYLAKNAVFIRSADFKKSFFLSSLEKPELKIKNYHSEQVSLFLDNFQNETYAKENRSPLYLWKKSETLSIQEKEKVSYKAFISPYGKVIFSFPEKLTINSSDNISSQEYMRQASIFFKDKFFWTKLEAVVR
jgi:hypothetical protein